MAKLGLFLLLILTVSSWRYAIKLALISREPLHKSDVETSVTEESAALPYPLVREYSKWKNHESVMDDKPDNIFYFVQLSDVHSSVFNKRGGIHHLRWFLNGTLQMLNPAFVVVTGDLTDAKDAWKISSIQHKQEWLMYYEALNSSGVLNKPGFWWDQRGNHDCFNVPGWRSHHNYFKEFSSVKQEQFSFEYNPSFGRYSFISLDACPIYGPSRPFNFFGYFDSKDMNFLEKRLEKHVDSNHTFVLSHYPISTTLTGYSSRTGRSFEQLGKMFSHFLCGHLHKLAGGIGEIMHAHHSSEFLELELSDLKSHGSYRVMAVDHDIVSFVDTSILPEGVKYKDPKAQEFLDRGKPKPLILITNPKDSRYIVPRHEPVDRIKSSSHIRFLVFSDRKIIETSVTIDGSKLGTHNARFSGNPDIPLWSIKWDPSNYFDKSTHILNVTVIDEDYESASHQTIFRLDNIRPSLDIGPGEHILLLSTSFWTPIIFFIGYFVIVTLLLLLPRLYSIYLHRTKKYHRWRLEFSQYLVEFDRPRPISLPPVDSISSLLFRWLIIWKMRLFIVFRDFKFFIHASAFRLVTLASLSKTFYPLYLYGLYIVSGPFFIGELIPSARLSSEQSMIEGLGWFYLYGIYIEKKWLPMIDTWIYGMFELIYLLGPLTIYLSFCITPPDQLYSKPPKLGNLEEERNIYWFPPIHMRRKYPLHRRIFVRLLVFMVVLYQLMNVFFIGLYYGPLAVLISPGKTWFCIWAIYALYKHRWSSKGSEIDLIDPENERKLMKRSWSSLNVLDDLKETLRRRRPHSQDSQDS